MTALGLHMSRDLYVFAAAAAEVSIFPRNVAVINGSTVTFNCIVDTTESELCWSHMDISAENPNYLFRQGNLTPVCDSNKCNVTFDNKTESYTLSINSVQLYDAGFYECWKCSGSHQSVAQLIVIQPFSHIEGIYGTLFLISITCHSMFLLFQFNITSFQSSYSLVYTSFIIIS